jgi:hypothetical protein
MKFSKLFSLLRDRFHLERHYGERPDCRSIGHPVGQLGSGATEQPIRV